MSRDHRKLEAFSVADRLVIDVYRETSDLPASERFGLQLQIRRSAVSVAANIVEGSARTSAIEYCRYLEIALASAREASYLFELAGRLGYSQDPNAAKQIAARYAAVQGMLHGIIRALSRNRRRPDHGLSPKP